MENSKIKYFTDEDIEEMMDNKDQTKLTLKLPDNKNLSKNLIAAQIWDILEQIVDHDCYMEIDESEMSEENQDEIRNDIRSEIYEKCFIRKTKIKKPTFLQTKCCKKEKVVTDLENIMKKLNNISDYYKDETNEHIKDAKASLEAAKIRIGDVLSSLEDAKVRIEEDEF